MTSKNYANKNELITEIYQYSKWNIEKLQDLNKKVESRILASLTLTGVVIKLTSDLFNNSGTEQKYMLAVMITIKFLAIGLLVWAGYNFLEGLKVKGITVESASVKSVDENFDNFNEDKHKFQNSITTMWITAEGRLTDVIKIKSNLLNNGIKKVLIAGAIYGMGAILENLIDFYF